MLDAAAVSITSGVVSVVCGVALVVADVAVTLGLVFSGIGAFSAAAATYVAWKALREERDRDRDDTKDAVPLDRR